MFMKFFDRKEEIRLLRDIREKSYTSARFTVLTGRRRIGKTSLVLHALGKQEDNINVNANVTSETNAVDVRHSDQDDIFLYFFVSRKAEKDLCKGYLHEIEEKIGTPVLGEVNSFAEIFKYLMKLSEQRHVTLFIDEFQDFTLVNPSIFSDMQMLWDFGKEKAKMNLIVGGSITSLMNKLFRDKEQPLYQRETNMIRLKPFSTSVLKEILDYYHPFYTKEDLLALYSFTGGVAKYVELFVENEAYTAESMIDAMVYDGSAFIEEGKVMLLGEFKKEYGTYFSILSAIASGYSSRAEIETAVGKEVSGYLTKLEDDYGLISRRIPVYQASKSRNLQYFISDNFLTFWFRFIFKYGYMLEIGGYAKMKEVIKRDYATFSGFMLERYFREKLAESGDFTRIGGWWDRKGANEIDIVASDDIEKRMQFIEVKRNAARYREALLREKIAAFFSINKQLAPYEYTISGLSIEDM